MSVRKRASRPSAATSFGEQENEQVNRPELTLATNDAANSFAGPIAITLGQVTESELVQNISAADLEELQNGYSTVTTGLDDAAEGASSFLLGPNAR